MVKKPGRGRPKKDKSIGPNPVDVHVGGRVRLRRLYMDMSQNSLARAIGLTFQQIQKYERGLNRISASRLFDLSRVLDAPVSFFFDDMPEDLAGSKPRDAAQTGPDTGNSSGLGDSLAERETVDLVRAYYAIEDRSVRRRIYEMTKALAADAARQDLRAAPFAPEIEDSNGAENGAESGTDQGR